MTLERIYERIYRGIDRRVRRSKLRLRNARPGIWQVKRRLKGPIVGCEVGVFKGIHALQMLQTLPNLIRLYLVDPYTRYTGYKDFQSPGNQLLQGAEEEAHIRLQPYRDRIIWVRDKFDAKHIPEPLDFIYIDGQHTYEAVTHDIRHATHLVKPGGIIAGHDYYPAEHRLNAKFGVGKAVREHYGKNHHFYISDWWVIKE